MPDMALIPEALTMTLVVAGIYQFYRGVEASIYMPCSSETTWRVV
jgi:hypothetical protein